MIRRDIRIVDIQILLNIGRSYSFFASTSIFVLAGLINVFGVKDRAIYFLRSAVLGFVQSQAMGNQDSNVGRRIYLRVL